MGDIMFLDDFITDVTCEEFYDDLPDGPVQYWSGMALCDLADMEDM